MTKLRPLLLISGLVIPLTATSLLGMTGTAPGLFSAQAAELHLANTHVVTFHPDGEEIEMVFLSDPFADVPPPPKSEIKRKAAKAAPKAPKPPTPKKGEAPDDFEDAMEEFEREMEAFEDEMEAFGEDMAEWGEAMGQWGKKMGAIGGTMGQVAEDCRDHQERSDEPAIISGRVDDTGQVIKAICATGGKERYMSDELTRYVSRHPTLSDAEKAYFLEHRDDPSTSYTD